MTIDEARKIVYEQEHELDNCKRMSTQTVSREYSYVAAKGFLLGWNAAVKKSVVIVDNYHNIPVDDGVYLRRQILKLLVEEEK